MRCAQDEKLEFAINSTQNSSVIIKLLKNWLSCLPEEIEKVFGIK